MKLLLRRFTLMILALVFALAAADWYAVARGNKRLEYIFKPAVMVGVIALTLSLTPEPHDGWQTRWFLVGFVFSLAGDVCLMVSSRRRSKEAGKLIAFRGVLCMLE